MTAVTQFISQLTDRTHLRRNITVGVAFIAILAIVLFSANISELLNKPSGSKAGTADDDLNRIWETLSPDDQHKAAHSKLIAATDPATGKRYLYAIGGVEVVQSVQQNRPKTVILDTVRRIEIDPTKGSVLPTATWQGGTEAWAHMKFGHMEFGLVEAGGYLYVVSGDINLPPMAPGQAINQSALLYSTVERLNLANPTAGWSVYALMAGVNFYPEVLVDTEGIHVVGGVYGNPFPPLQPDVAPTYIEDMLDAGGDATKWTTLNLATKMVIGGTGLFVDNIKINQPTVGGSTINLTPPSAGSGDGSGGNELDGSDSGGAPGSGRLRPRSEPMSFQIQQANRESFVAPTSTSIWTSGATRTLRVKISGFTPVPTSVRFEWRTDPLGSWSLKGTSTNREPQGSDYYFSLATTVPYSGADNGNNQVRATIFYDNGSSNIIMSQTFHTVERTLTVTKPALNEPPITGGTVYGINWTSTGIPSNYLIKIQYSPNGTTWKDAYDPNGSSTSSNDGSFDWVVPNDPSTSAKVRIWMYNAYFDPHYDAYAESAPFVMSGSEIVSDKLTQSLISGSFVTSVSEHYIVNISDPFLSLAYELKSDFVGTLSPNWTPGTVTYLGHLRFYVNTDGSVVPVPQGRYGHKLIRNFASGSIGVIGGASWFKEQEVVTASATENFKSFWVIEDAIHPIHQTSASHFEFNFGATPQGSFSYKFVGNIAYSYSPITHRFKGTNEAMGSGNDFAGESLSPSYSLKDASGTKGRAFFGMADIPGRPVVVGGLENALATDGSAYERVVVAGKSYFRLNAIATDRAELLVNNGWTSQPAYRQRLNIDSDTGYKPAYNLQGFALNGKALFYGGQSDFNLTFESITGGLAHDAHVPDYQFSFGPKTMMYVLPPTGPGSDTAEVWFPMSDLGTSGAKAVFNYVRVEPGTRVVTPGDQISYSATAYDSNGIILSGSTCQWSLIPSADLLGDIDETGIFTADSNLTLGSIANDGVVANCTIGTLSVVGSATIGVYPAGSLPTATLSRVEVSPPRAIIPIGRPRQFSVKAFDQFGTQLTTGLAYDWHEDGTTESVSFKDNITNQATITAIGKTANPLAVIKVNVSFTATSGVITNRIGSANVIVPEKMFQDGNASESFAGDYMVSSGNTDAIKAVYHFGGIGSGKLESLGLFGAGDITGSLTLSPTTITSDGFYGSNVTITLVNGLGEAVFQDGNGNRFAAYLSTLRSGGGLVTTDQTFNPNKKERVELIGEPAGTGGHNAELVYFDNFGKARFKIYSNEVTLGTIVSGVVEVPSLYISAIGNMTATLVVQEQAGERSNMVADKLKVASDGVDRSRITVTLRNTAGAGVPSTLVKLTSTRGGIDNISPATATTGADGSAVFTVKSTIEGLATIRAYYAPNPIDLESNPTELIENLTLSFGPLIGILDPNFIRQDSTIGPVIATGWGTHWEDGNTKVEYIRTSRKQLTLTSASEHIKANGLSKTTITITAPNYPNRQINLTISGRGSIVGNQTSVNTDATGTKTFEYQSGGNPGATIITATIPGTTGPIKDELRFIAEDNHNHPYELVVTSPPTSVAPGNAVPIKAGIYKYENGVKTLVTSQTSFEFTSYPGTLTPSTRNSTQGFASVVFNRDTSGQPAQVLATATYQGIVLGTKIIVYPTSPAGDLTASLPTIQEDDQKITVGTLTADSHASIGPWIFRAYTEAGAGTGNYEIADYTFRVLPAPPSLVSIVENIGFRDTEQTIVITGLNGNFNQSSQVVFTKFSSDPNVTVDSTGITKVGNFVSVTSDVITMKIKIDHNASMGFWNVRVDTVVSGETIEARMVGNKDFLVTTPTDIEVDVLPVPTAIARDGVAFSDVTTYIGKLDRETGNVTAQAGVEVVFSFDGGDAGTLVPTEDGPNAPGIKTNAQGKVVNRYTSDVGQTSDDAIIRATVVIEALTTSNTGTISKGGGGNIVSLQQSTVSAVPKYVPADGNAFSVITVTVRNSNYVGLAGKIVTLTSSNPTLDTISPATPVTTNALGKAVFQISSSDIHTSNLTATVDNITLATNVHFVDPSSVLRVVLDTIVPLEAKSYDRLVKLYLREPVTGQDPVIDEVYSIDATDHVVGLPVLYFKPGTSYSYWAKGRFHLARVKSPVQVATAGTVSINFTAVHRGTSKGLLIADLNPDINNGQTTFWHDNSINAVDFVKIIQSWFKPSYEADLNNDGIVNSNDFNYWLFNYGPGENQP